jgi:Kef-type K+ transport system membrane component KefB
LLELGRLRTREGAGLLGAAVIDDILVIMILAAILVVVGGSGTLVGVVLQLGRMILALAAVGVLALWVLPRVAGWSVSLKASEALLAVTLSSVLVLAWMTEYLGGVAAITGAFLAGVGLRGSHLREELEAGLHRLAYGFFVPLFLVDIGLQSNVRLLDARLALFSAVLIPMAIISKIGGSGLGAWLGRFSKWESFRVGIGMVSRGEVGLIVAGVEVAEGFLGAEEFTVVVLTVLATTLLTPIMLRWAVTRQEVVNATTRRVGGS